MSICNAKLRPGLDDLALWKKEVSFSKALENVELMQSCCSHNVIMETARTKEEKETKKVKEKGECVKKKCGHKIKRSRTWQTWLIA